MTALNSPLEVSVRVLALLVESYPVSVDVGRLVFMDHGVLNSADLGGPASIHPVLPTRIGELGLKRHLIEQGLDVMARAGYVELRSTDRGIEFLASDEAYSFTSILTSSYAVQLKDRARWVVSRLLSLTDEELRAEFDRAFGSWAEEFDLGPEGEVSS